MYKANFSRLCTNKLYINNNERIIQMKKILWNSITINFTLNKEKLQILDIS